MLQSQRLNEVNTYINSSRPYPLVCGLACFYAEVFPMAMYEYHCDECGKTFETIQKIGAPPIDECPHCHSNKVNKLISKCTFSLKGGGWYANGYTKAA